MGYGTWPAICIHSSLSCLYGQHQQLPLNSFECKISLVQQCPSNESMPRHSISIGKMVAHNWKTIQSHHLKSSRSFDNQACMHIYAVILSSQSCCALSSLSSSEEASASRKAEIMAAQTVSCCRRTACPAFANCTKLAPGICSAMAISLTSGVTRS